MDCPPLPTSQISETHEMTVQNNSIRHLKCGLQQAYMDPKLN